jgi:hypothetical protein
VNASNGLNVLSEQCSTALYNYNNTDSCSVGTSLIANPFCSTSAMRNYCSTNVANGAGPLNCSVSDSNVAQAACSAGAAGTCSTQVDGKGKMSGSTCSIFVVNPPTQGMCSVGTLAGNPGNTAGTFCSAATGQLPAPPNNGPQNNNCSVVNATGNPDRNVCSTDGTNGANCSVNNPGNLGKNKTNDFCSVVTTQGNTTTNAQCTVINGVGGTGGCSAFSGNPPAPVAGQMQCSVIGAGGFISGPVGGKCTVP